MPSAPGIGMVRPGAKLLSTPQQTRIIFKPVFKTRERQPYLMPYPTELVLGLGLGLGLDLVPLPPELVIVCVSRWLNRHGVWWHHNFLTKIVVDD